MFSSVVPVQRVPSSMQAFHDALARVAARICSMTPAFSDTVRPPEEAPPVPAVAGGNCVLPEASFKPF